MLQAGQKAPVAIEALNEKGEAIKLKDFLETLRALIGK